MHLLLIGLLFYQSANGSSVFLITGLGESESG